ncbi:MAG: hypothetical protein H0U12_13020 [Thermoleophilaceae bacterium]|nr:hypothetical protein [Thermoleophilaceae bacterium]
MSALLLHQVLGLDYHGSVPEILTAGFPARGKRRERVAAAIAVTLDFRTFSRMG